MIFRSLLLLALCGSASAQDLYDDSVVREVTLDFHDTNWWQQLKANWSSGTNILADMTVDGIPFLDVGVHIKGNSSYFFLDPADRKASLGIDLDHVHVDQQVYGHSTLNLNNGIEDPTFCREITFQNVASGYTPNGRGAHCHLTINGGDWGVYINIEQYNRGVLGDFFPDDNGLRFKCPNNPAGPGLSYQGQNKAIYQQSYELKDWLGHPDPWQVLIDACEKLDTEPLSNVDVIDDWVAIDAALWTVALENVFMDEDSYISKGADFTTFWDPRHEQLHLHLHDANESFGVSYFGWPAGTLWELPPLYNKNKVDKPVLHRLLDVPELQQRYFAHMRTFLDEEFYWDKLGPRLAAYQLNIDAMVQADPWKLYSYQDFVDNFNQTVIIEIGGSFVPAPGLSEFVQNRNAYLATNTKVDKPAPEIPSVAHSPQRPNPGAVVTVRATVLGPNADVGDVHLYYRSLGQFLRTPMFDDGNHADGSSGDNVFAAQLPITGTPGEGVEYYVGAASDTSVGAMTFHPRKTEHAPLEVVFGWGPSGVKVTEYMYTGNDGEFFELTNTGATPVDLTGWSMDDQSDVPGTLDLSAAGVLAPGQSVIISQSDPATFANDWGLAGVTILGPNLIAPIGRNDQINIYDAGGVLVERLTYGDEAFPGAPRAQNVTATPCDDALGADDPFGWLLALDGDAMGSTTSLGGDVGNPGVFAPTTCPSLGDSYCDSNANSTGSMADLSALGSPLIDDNQVELFVSNLPVGQPGYFLMADTTGNVPNFGGSQGVLCLGSPIVRFSSSVLFASAAGEVYFAPDLGALPNDTLIQPGERWNFQLWYRDVNPGQTSNTSNAVGIDFE